MQSKIIITNSKSPVVQSKTPAKMAYSGSIATIRDKLLSKSLTAKELTSKLLQHASSVNKQVNSFVHIDEQGALLQAEEIDKKIAQGQPVGPLAGIPIAIKDNIATKGLQTTAGSRSLQGYIPPYDATIIDRLRSAGAILIGKTNMDEFGMGSSTESSGYGVTRNPWALDRVPGGSSGGSAAAMAADMCLAAIGSDTGGSIRQPAHFCGVVGLKPTYGRVSRNGLIAYASSLDTIGPLTHSVADAAQILQVIAGHDAADSTCSTRPVDDYISQTAVPALLMGDKPLAGRRFGIISETKGGGGIDTAVSDSLTATASHLESLGAIVEEVSLPTYANGLPAYYVIALSEASSNLSRYDGVRYGHRFRDAKELREMYTETRSTTLGAEVKRRILMGTYALSAGYYDAYYKRAQQVRTLVQRELGEALSAYDALLTPVAPTAAYTLGDKSADPLTMYKGDLMTVCVNLAGLPAVVVPCNVVNNLPIGVQMIGKAFGEADLLSLAHVYQITRDLQLKCPLSLAVE